MKIAVMAGSFDPVTKGHTWVMKQALELADHLIVIVGHNPAKKYMFTESERKHLVSEALCDELDSKDVMRFSVASIGNQLVIDYAKEQGARMLVRGIRNSDDFRVESEMNMIHKRMWPEIDTAYFIPPRELTEVSSSVVKSIVGFDRWQRTVSQYVAPCVLVELMKKAEKKV